LEHLDDEARALGEALRICKSGGWIILTVPAYQFLWGGEDEISMHKRRYTKARLFEAVRNSGWQIERISYFNTILFPIICSILFFNKLFCPRARHESNLKELSAVVNIALTKIFLFEARLLKKINFLFGASLICVAKKR